MSYVYVSFSSGNNSLAEVVYGMVRARKRRTGRRGRIGNTDMSKRFGLGCVITHANYGVASSRNLAFALFRNLHRVTQVVASLGWVDMDFEFHCLPDSAQVDESLAELAGQVAR